MKNIDRPAHPFDGEFLKHTPGGHDHDQKTHGGGGGGGSEPKATPQTPGQKIAANLYAGNDWAKPFHVGGKTLTPNKTTIRVTKPGGQNETGLVTAVWRDSEEEWNIEYRTGAGSYDTIGLSQLDGVVD